MAITAIRKIREGELAIFLYDSSEAEVFAEFSKIGHGNYGDGKSFWLAVLDSSPALREALDKHFDSSPNSESDLCFKVTPLPGGGCQVYRCAKCPEE